MFVPFLVSELYHTKNDKMAFEIPMDFFVFSQISYENIILKRHWPLSQLKLRRSMLSVCNFQQLCDIIEEKGGQWIVKDLQSGIYIFTSPDGNRFQNLRNPQTAAEYFKLINKPDLTKYDYISRIGIRSADYYPHYKSDTDHNAFLKNDTIRRLEAVLNAPYVPNKANRRLFNDLLRQKNEQIQQYNDETGNTMQPLDNFTNWQATIINTNMLNGHNPVEIIKNDRAIIGDRTNDRLIPFSTAMPEYNLGLAASEQRIRDVDKVTRNYKRF